MCGTSELERAHAEPLRRVPQFEPRDLAEPQPIGKLHGPFIRHLGTQNDVAIGQRTCGPSKDSDDSFGRVSPAPVRREERVADLELAALVAHVTRLLTLTSIQHHDSDEVAVRFDGEEAGVVARNIGRVQLEFHPRSGATEIATHLVGREKIEVAVTVTRSGRTQNQPRGNDVVRGPECVTEFGHSDDRTREAWRHEASLPARTVSAVPPLAPLATRRYVSKTGTRSVRRHLGDAPMIEAGNIILLNGPPRAGKTTIAKAIQERFDGVWMYLGMDSFKAMTPSRFQPGISLRPGGERPDLEPLVAALYRGMYQAVADHSRLGVNVIADATHHENYSQPLGILATCAELLRDRPMLFVADRCPVDVVRERRRATWGGTGFAESSTIADPVDLWQRATDAIGPYDLAVDTSLNAPEECADIIGLRLAELPAPSALMRHLPNQAWTSEP